jgi:hypothetical protein
MTPSRPFLPSRLLTDAAAAGFGALARARGTRALHPRGDVWAARAVLDDGVPGVTSAVAPPRWTGEALLRTSRALGLPGWAPDVLGVAIRLVDLHGPGRHQDLLLASCGPPPAHLTLAPALSSRHRWYTGLLPYRVGDRRGVLVAEQVGERRYLLGLARLGRGVAPLGQVSAVGGPLSGGPERIRFDVMLHGAPAFRQDAGPLDALRRRSYERSRVAGPGAG